MHIDALVPEKRISITNELELRLSCTNPSIYVIFITKLYTSSKGNLMQRIMHIVYNMIK